PRPGRCGWPRPTQWDSAKCSSVTGHVRQAIAPLSQVSSPEEPTMAAESCIECDVAIVGAGFAGALIANEFNKDRNNPVEVVILEAGAGVPPNINEYMQRFYTATAKVPESAYTP